MSDNDFKQHVNSSQDFYALLEVESTASEAEIRRAYRQTARKYHPDKVGASNKVALEKFHLLQIAYGILSDESLKELYDNARKAREEKKARESAFSDRRKAMVEELERRETAGAKRKHEELGEEDKLEQEIRRLAADGKRKREELQSRLRQEELQREALGRHEQEQKQQEKTEPHLQDIDRALSLRYVKDESTSHWNDAFLRSVYGRFGDIEAIVLREKKLKAPGAKHRTDYYLATILFKTFIGAHAAITRFPDLQAMDVSLAAIENVTWAGAREPASSTSMPPTVALSNGTNVNGTSSERQKVPKFSFNPKATA